MLNEPLKAPFPYFGGKASIAPMVWQRFGVVQNYVEPFAGSLAMLLANTEPPNTETVNDLDGYLVNFWRALQAAPREVARWADYPVSEIDLHARHIWLVNKKTWLLEKMGADPDFYDAKIAGWWVWGVCSWIGGGWCSGDGPWQVIDGKFVDTRQLPHLGNAGMGVNRRRPHLGNAGRGVNRQLPHLGDAGHGVNLDAGIFNPALYEYFEQLAARLRRVRICYGEWHRVTGPTPTFKNGLTAVFLDPPYDMAANKRAYCYNHETDVSAAVREWALANGDNPLLRIALCGYEGEHEMPGWECMAWKTRGGYGNQRKAGDEINRTKERIWFSPHCLKVKKQQVSFMEVLENA